MTTYVFDPSGFTVGQQPAGWSVPTGWAAPTAFTVETDGTDKFLRITGANDSAIKLDAIDADANRATFDILCRLRITDIAAASSVRAGPVARGGSGRDGYYVGPQDVNTLRMEKVVAGTESTVQNTTMTAFFSNSGIYWCRFQGNGTALKSKVWTGDVSAQPGTWNQEPTDADISAAGFIGLYCNGAARVPEILYFSVGTNGDAPPEPSAATALTLSGPSSGANNTASTNFTVGANGSITGTVTVTPASDLAGSFSPTTVQISAAAPTATFTFTPTATGSHSITLTNDGSLTNPAAHTYNVSAGNTITIDNPPIDDQFYNAASGTVDITPTGTCSLDGATIEARVKPFAGGADLVTWTALGTVASNAFGGTPITVPKEKGKYVLEVRIQSDTGTTATQTQGWHPGFIAMVFGQSHLAAAFTSGSGTYNTNASGSVYTFDGTTFTAANTTGAGKVALFNILALHADCDVCLINDSGSGFPIDRWYDTATTAQYATMDAMADQIPGGISAFGLWQGDGNTNTGDTRATYLVKANGLLSAIRTDNAASTPAAIMALGIANQAIGDDNSWENIRDAHVSLATIPFAPAGPNNIVMPTYDLEQGVDEHHFTDAGTVEGCTRLGHAMARQYGYGGANYAIPPRVTSATVSGTTVTINIALDGASDLTPNSGYTLITFYDNGTPLAYSGSTKISGTRIDYTLTSAPAGTLTMRVGYGRFPDVSVVPTDTAVISRPLQTTDGDVTVTTATTATLTPSGPYNGSRVIWTDGTGVIINVLSATVAGQLVDSTATTIASGAIPPFTSANLSASTLYAVQYIIGGVAVGSEMLTAS